MSNATYGLLVFGCGLWKTPFTFVMGFFFGCGLCKTPFTFVMGFWFLIVGFVTCCGSLFYF
jgi:hypothetical protein